MHIGSLRTARALVFAVALSTLVAIAYLSNRNWQDFARSRDESVAASQALEINERLLGLVRDSETGQRGYLLTGDPEYLAPYREAQSLVAPEIQRLRSLLAGQQQQLARLDRLDHLIGDKLRELRLTMDARQKSGLAAALAIISNNRGRQLMDGIRVLSNEIDLAARQNSAASQANVSRHSAQARLVTLAGCAVLLFILVAAFAVNESSAVHRERLISELAAANRASAEARDLLRSTFYSIGDGVITTDAEARVELMNAMAERLTGFKEAEARGKPLEEIFQAPPGAGAASTNPVRPVLAGGSDQAAGKPFRLRSRDGVERYVEAGVSAIRGAGNATRGAVLVFRNVSDRMRTEERLRQSAKLESLGVLAGGIAHDFNNLLAGVVGASSLLEEYFPPGTEGRDLLDTVQAAAERASRLTNQMLAYSGRGGFDIRSIDLSQETNEILPLLKASIPKHVELRLATASDLPRIEADTAQLQQLIMNLAINAAEAVGAARGFVEISTSRRRVAENSVLGVTGDPVPPGSYVVLMVTDNGHGMDESTRARIFDPFFTTKFTGRGLGLAATLGIVKGHGGAIEVDSSPGSGATFRVYFPAADVAQESAPRETA